MKKEVFDFSIPLGIATTGDIKLWGWNPDNLGVVGVCIDRHEEWAEDDEASDMYQLSGVKEPEHIAYVPWHELDDDLIVECQSQMFAFNDVSRSAVGCMALLYSGEIGTIKKVEFRLATDEERLATLKQKMPISFITCDFEVETDKVYYTGVKDYDIKFIDTSPALMPSMEMKSLQKLLKRDLIAEKNKIVSLEEWKKKKGIDSSKESANETGK